MHNFKMGEQRPLPRAKGNEIEHACHDFLVKQNIRIITRNFYSKFGEIDIIGLDKDTVVFFEIRYRHQNHFGTPLESVTRKKQERIHKTALFFITKHPKFQQYAYRFDIIGASTYNGKLEFHWQQDAFQVSNTWI